MPVTTAPRYTQSKQRHAPVHTEQVATEGRVEWEGGGVSPQRGGSSGREGV